MKKIYQKPELEIVQVAVEAQLCAASSGARTVDTPANDDFDATPQQKNYNAWDDEL